MDDFQRRNNQRRNNQQSFQPRTRTERLGSRVSQMSGKNGKKGKYSRFFNKKWFILVGLTTLLLIIGGCSAVMMSASVYNINELNKLDFSTSVFDNNGKQIGRIGSVYREYISMKDLERYNPDLPKAFVKVEDQRFYQHSGVDWYGLGRAVFKNILAGGKGEGGGTITMQVARNVLLKDREKTYTRKLKEIAAALNIEHKYSKDQILETYLNYIDFGNQVAGIEMAAKIYFGKDLKKQKLEPQEIAFLAGLPKAPSTYNPYRGPKGVQKAIERRNVVLMKMAENNELPPLITEAEKVKLQKMPLGTNEEYLAKYSKRGKYQAYTNQVLKEIGDRYDLSSEDLNSNGYKIITGIDTHAQQVVEEAMKTDSLFKGKKSYDGQVDSGVTMIDPHTGLIKAIGGGRNYKPGSLNRARQKVQPGSSIKPLAVFSPAVEEKGFNQYTPFMDAPYKVGNWSPKNFSNGFAGNVTMDEVVYDSINVVTVKMLMEDVGLDNAYAYAKDKFKLPLVEADKAPAALALGGLTHGVNSISMAQAYTTFPNNGEMATAHTIIRIVDKNGKEVPPKDGQEIDAKGNPSKVLSPTTAWYMTNMMRDVVENPHGTAHSAIKLGRQVAGKTGTISKEDAGWFVGYTPDLVLAVNVFNDVVDGVKGNAQITGGSMPAKVFNYIMKHTLENTPAKDFQKPEGVKDPVPPFQLQAPNLSGSYNADNNSIQLSWQKQDSRVVYTIQRSEDGVNFTDLQTNVSGNSFTDTSVQQPGGGFGGIFGGGNSEKSYYYKVIATDTQATDQAAAQKSSGTLQVKVKANQQDNSQQPCDQNGQPAGCTPQDNNGKSNGTDNSGQNNANGNPLNNGGQDTNGTTDNGTNSTNDGGQIFGGNGGKNKNGGQ
ncbi:transglycosylase domain-containing protein [Shimazuella sp. AN120528]|uniref:transglycosylase domain-containing protein n=1 Tax=Shimazuella soli TaxID=1892854 RepID=UPI001F0EEA28|nr:transglycosylase domain-containing protein [Shimazuella soli]MCH5586540.1 transglycosylase domain-containing protein [Shimazuella soli]